MKQFQDLKQNIYWGELLVEQCRPLNGDQMQERRMIYTHLVVFRRMDEKNKRHFFIMGRTGLRLYLL